MEKFVTENPKTQICFLLTQRYPIGISVENLRAADRVLFEILSPHYQLDLGLYSSYPHYLNLFLSITFHKDEWPSCPRPNLKTLTASSTVKNLNLSSPLVAFASFCLVLIWFVFGPKFSFLTSCDLSRFYKSSRLLG